MPHDLSSMQRRERENDEVLSLSFVVFPLFFRGKSSVIVQTREEKRSLFHRKDNGRLFLSFSGGYTHVFGLEHPD